MTKLSKEFYKVVSQYLRGFVNYTLVDCCSGDGKAGIEFDSEPNIEKIIFLDIRQPNKFKWNSGGLVKPFEYRIEGIESFEINGLSVLIALHSCGTLSDIILEKAVASESPVAIIPCCYTPDMKKYDLMNSPDKRKLLYSSEKDYYDAFRMQFLREHNYYTVLETMNSRLTPMNNVLIGIPPNR